MLPHILMTVKGLMLLAAAVFGFAALLPRQDADWVRRGPLIIFLALFLIGMWGQTVWVEYIALTLSIPLLARTRADAAALFCIAAVATPRMATKIVIGSFYLMPVNKYVFCAIGLAIAFLIKPSSGPRLRRARFDLPILIIMILELSQTRDPSFTATLRESLPVFLGVLLPYYLLSRSLNDAQDVRRFLVACSLSAFVMAAVAVVESRLHWLIYKQVESALHVQMGINGYSKMRAGMLRAPASFPESTSLGIFLAIMLMAILVCRSSFASRNKWFAALGLVVLGLLSANSRGALIAVGIGVLAHDFYMRRYAALAAKAFAAGGLYLVVLMLAQFSAFFGGLVGKGSGTEATTDYRWLLFHRGLQEIRKHPIAGTSMKTALDHLQDLRQGEGIVDLVNGYISYGLTLGYLGMIGLAAVFVSLCLAMLAMRRKVSGNPALLLPASGVFSVAAFSIVSSFFGGFGGDGSTPFYQMCAIGSFLWAARSLAPTRAQPGALPSVAPPATGLAGMIAADRARAKQAFAAGAQG